MLNQRSRSNTIHFTITNSTVGSRSTRSVDAETDATSVARSDSLDDRSDWKQDQVKWNLTFEECEALEKYGDDARSDKGDAREAFLAYSVCVKAMPLEAAFWMARADLTLFDMKMFYRSVNDSQTAALCLNKKNQVSRSVLSKSSGNALSGSPRASRSKSQSPQNGFNNLEEIFRRDQKKILANALYLKSLARYHLGDFDKAKSSLSEAEKELKFCLKDSSSNAETSTRDLFDSIKKLKTNIATFKSVSDHEYFKWIESHKATVMIKDESQLPAWFESEEEFEELLEEMAEFWLKEMGKGAEGVNDGEFEVEAGGKESEEKGYQEVEMQDL